MATINYNGMELEEFTSDKPVIFDKPVRALCWDNSGCQGGLREYVIAFIPRSDSSIAVTDHSIWPHMALLPEAPKPRRATNRELARWLAQGNGEYILQITAGMAEHYWNYEDGDEDEPANGYDSSDNELKVRKWSETEWHEPTVDYLFGGDK